MNTKHFGDCTCMQRAYARIARLHPDPDTAEIARDALESLRLSPDERLAAEDPCPVHSGPRVNIFFTLFAFGVFEEAAVRRGERPASEIVYEQIIAGAEPYQMQGAGRA